jgi:hypothetical protein
VRIVADLARERQGDRAGSIAAHLRDQPEIDMLAVPREVLDLEARVRERRPDPAQDGQWPSGPFGVPGSAPTAALQLDARFNEPTSQ